MKDPFSWSVPLARVLGVMIRVHVLFIFTTAVLLLSAWFHPGETDPPAGRAWDALIFIGLLFGSIVIHELGHCIGAWWENGDVASVTLWPLGGLDALDLPHRAKARLIATVCGPIANLLICCAAGACLRFAYQLNAPLGVSWSLYRGLGDAHGPALATLSSLNGDTVAVHDWRIALVARVFWINWLLLASNLLLPAFPLDCGRIVQCFLWPRVGFRQATQAAGYMGFLTEFALGAYAVVWRDFLWLCAALLIYRVCQHQMILLEAVGDETILDHGFIPSNLTLENRPRSGRRRLGLWQRWLHRRAVRRIERQQELREAEERRMDELLEKVQQHGLDALSDDERRFLKRVSDRYRNRQ